MTKMDLDMKPQPGPIDLSKTAVIMIDMQVRQVGGVSCVVLLVVRILNCSIAHIITVNRGNVLTFYLYYS